MDFFLRMGTRTQIQPDDPRLLAVRVRRLGAFFKPIFQESRDPR